MKKLISLGISAVLCASLFAGCSSNTDSQSQATNADPLNGYPSEAIQFIVNRAAGGSSDQIARAVATSLQDEAGYTTVVMNVDGGDGLIGANEAMSAEPNGYTFMVVGSLEMPNLLVNFDGTVFEKEDIVPVCQVSSKSNILILKPDSPFSTVEEFTAYAKEHPGELTVAVAGSNAVFGPLAMEKALDIDLTIVNSGSGNDAYAAVLGGHVDCAMVSTNFYVNATAENLTVLAGTANREEHIDGQPDTFLSMGYDIVNEQFTYVCAPAGTPDEIVKFISDEIGKLAESGVLVEALNATNNECDFMGQEEFAPYFTAYLDEQIQAFEALNEAEE